MQAAVNAISRTFAFEGPGGKIFEFNGEGPFVEYIERTMIQRRGEWIRLNDAFLPGNAKQVFQSTMPKTRGTQSWAGGMREKLNSDPAALRAECEANGWIKSLARLKR
jgi:hypothetical protein